MLLKDALNTNIFLYEDMMDKAQKKLDNLTKPLGSLGRLEGFVKQIVGITGELVPKVDKKMIILMCADNGVVEEGISQSSKEITSIVTQNFTKGFTGINVLSRHSNAEIKVVDIGIDDDIDNKLIINKKIRKGTRNMAKGPAMTEEEVVAALQAGIDTVGELKGKGYNLLGTGEMGIGNTTTSSAVASVLTGNSIEGMVGKGAGLSSEGLLRKISVIKAAIAINKPNPDDPIDVLSKLGGFDIAGLAGCFIGAAIYRLPILIDGFISATAALVAVKIKPEVINFIIPSHGSSEPGNNKVMQALGMEPILNLEMRLGEGTGAALAFHIIDAALAAYTQMGTFDDASIEQYKPL